MLFELMPTFRLRFALVALIVVLESSVLNGVRAEDTQTNVYRHDVSPPQQEWQIRRGDFFRALKTANQGQGVEQEQARAKVSTSLETLKADQVSLTPMEGMDIYGAILLSAAGEADMKAMLMGIATIATLGWYDALRFTDESGWAEIYGNERFFTRALELSGGVKRIADFLTGHPDEAADAANTGPGLVSSRSTLYHSAMLGFYGVPLVLLAKQMAAPLDAMVLKLHAPLALGGFVMAVLVLTPESIAAIRAARSNRLQRSVNILLGSVLASIGLTIPLVIAVALATGRTLVLGLDATDTVMLMLTLVTSLLTFSLPRTNVLPGCVHLLLFGAYLMLLFDR